MNNDTPVTELTYSLDRPPAKRCKTCNGSGIQLIAENRKDSRKETFRPSHCEACEAIGYFGIDPSVPTICMPGTSDKVAVMAARRRDGIDPFNDHDATRDREGVFLARSC